MIYRFLTLLSLCTLCFVTASAQSGISAYHDRNAFSAAARDLGTHDFEGLVPNSAFKHYQKEGALHYAGLEFRPGGGARFGPGPVIVVGGWYQAGPAYETTTGAKLHWSPPNQPGNAYLDIALPNGITAVGTDVWTVQPSQGTIEVTLTTSDGKSRTESISTPSRPAAGFIGFTSSSPIVLVRFTPPKGQTGLIVDNFTVGISTVKGAGDIVRRNGSTWSENSAPSPANVGPVNRIPRTPAAGQTIPPSTARQNEAGTPTEQGRNPSSSANSRGDAIAYIRNGTEIRLINPDGTNDRQIWTHRDLHPELGIFELAWKPDGSELAFSSAHEATVSLYLADLYTIRADGSGLRKLTNAPDRPGFARFPKGSVTVTVPNDQPGAETSGSFIVYVAGADEPQQVVVPAGTAKTLVFKSVADFGKHSQPVVAMFGKYRWFNPGVDVIAGRNVNAPPLDILGKGFDMFGAFRPVWRYDGSRLSYRSGLCVVSTVSPNPTPGEHSFNPLFGGKNPMGTCTWDWGPTAATANQVIYSENSSGGSNVFQMTEGGTHPGTKLAQFSDIDYQLLYELRWLPDASGLLYSTVNLFRDSANIFRYDFATNRTTQLTKFDKEFGRAFSISPDGRSIVFERCSTADEDAGCDLWTMGVDGKGARLLVKNGQRPAWGK